MVNTNKVLTVSYGTFSCTLEGFDDSFGTMKAIAEYFRDLAADDRYFGAEPPQPDVDMLARIAQREISRRVEAHSDGTGVVLRAAQPDVTPAETPAMPSADEPGASDAPAVMPDAGADSATTSPDAAPEVMPDVTGPDDMPSMEKHAAPETIDMEPVDVIPTRIDAEVEIEAEIEVETAPEPVAEIMPEPVAETTPDPQPAPAPDSIAAKLQRIRAVVSRAGADGVDSDFSEDEHADSFLTVTPQGIAEDRPEEISSADISTEMTEIEETCEDEFEEETAEGDDLSLTLPELGRFDDVGPNDASEHAEDGSATNRDEASDALPGASLLDEEFTDEESEIGPEIGDASDVDGDTEDTIFTELDAPEPESAAEPEIENMLKSDAEPETAPSDKPIRARVVKVRRADLESAIAGGTLEEIDVQPSVDSSLSDEAERDLMRELAEVEAEIGAELGLGAGDDAQETGNSDLDQPVAGHEGDRIGPDDDVSRLMDEAGQKMEEPESTTRRETYSQLRAAVAATNAERAVTGEVPQLTHDQAFRDDLANVVRPRRPAASGDNGQRPKGDRQAPLKLVAEQRVDDAAADARRGPVRPRRVSPADVKTALSGDVGGTPGGFAAFAHEAGATGLSELLEAAAAYLSYVEGRDQFSRPQLMTKVRQVEQEDFNREDGLRSFGQLLREGKIRKTRGGRFTASEDIGFKPARRAAG